MIFGTVCMTVTHRVTSSTSGHPLLALSRPLERTCTPASPAPSLTAMAPNTPHLWHHTPPLVILPLSGPSIAGGSSCKVLQEQYNAENHGDMGEYTTQNISQTEIFSIV